jgi:glycosyltransferase involved in cell wall biosynthesis
MAEPLEGRETRELLLSVVVPLFNEEQGISELVERTVAGCRAASGRFELVLVNDGSRDATLARLVEWSCRVGELRIVDLNRNYGHMPALFAGLAAAEGDAVVVMDGDLQDPPEVIPDLVTRWREGADVVYGLRTRRHDGLLLGLGTRLFYRLLRRSCVAIPEHVGTFGLMDRSVVDVLNALPERSRFFAGLRSWVGGRQEYVPYERQKRGHGRSRVGLLGLVSLAETALISFSKLPLRAASGLSLLCAIVMLLVGVTAIAIRAFTSLGVPGWATYTTLIGLMGFVQSLTLALIAEYVGVIFDEVKARPLFVVRSEFRRGTVVPLVGARG